MGKPAARVTDTVAHPIPPMLTGGPGSLNVMIGNLPAWRAIPTGAGIGLQAAKQTANIALQTAKAASMAASGTPAYPGVKATEEALKISTSIAMSNLISSVSMGADIHMCGTPLPIPPHGPGVVIDGSMTVMINGLPAATLGCTIIEALGPPNKITKGCMTVMIG